MEPLISDQPKTKKTLRAHSPASGRLLIILTALLWGLAGVCVKSVTWSTMSIIATRNLISLVLLGGFRYAQRKSLKLSFNRINVFGSLMMSITGILYIGAIKLTTAGTAIVLQYIAPILVFLYTVIFKHKKPRLIEVLLTAAVFAGCVLSFADSIDLTALLGNLLAILSGFSYAAQIILMNHPDGDSEDASIISNGMSFLVCLPFMFFDSGLSFDAKNLFWIAVIGILQYGLANLLFAKGIQKTDAVEASLLLTIEPIFNPIPVMIFCGETMGFKSVIGFVIVIMSVTAYSVLSKKKAGNPEGK